MPVNFPRSPKLLKGGILVMDPASGNVRRTIALQYNPQTLTRKLEPQWYEPQQGDDGKHRLSYKGPAVETFQLEAELDATDQLEEGDSTARDVGIHPQLAALELLVYPTSQELQQDDQNASRGTMKIAPHEAPLTVFVWSKSRIAPVKLTELGVTEEFFDPDLNPLRARITLGMRVLTVDDLTHQHRGGTMFIAYLQAKEALADRIGRGNPRSLTERIG